MRLLRFGYAWLRAFRSLTSTIHKSEVDGKLLLGKIVQISQIGLERIPCVKVRCRLNEFDEYLKMYFTYSNDYWAMDPQSQADVGDDVLIRSVKKASRTTAAVKHSVEKVVFKYGNVIDPITKKRVVQESYSDEKELEKQLVKDIVEDPFKEESLLFEERRAIQRQQLLRKRESIESAEEK